MRYQWRARWREEWTVTAGAFYGRKAGEKWVERKDVLVRRQYKQPSDAAQALPSLQRNFPPHTTWLLEPMET